MKKIVSLAEFQPLTLKGVWWIISFPLATGVRSLFRNTNTVETPIVIIAPFRAGVKSQSKEVRKDGSRKTEVTNN
ncbi:MAG: hypothetical protein RIE86_06880 [Imperialibacter sp.]|uniref:hypothetical protein n=1 Tax=Imperialibacter sp. TaxID=2038411 RepID=UPI0032EC5792